MNDPNFRDNRTPLHWQQASKGVNFCSIHPTLSNYYPRAGSLSPSLYLSYLLGLLAQLLQNFLSQFLKNVPLFLLL
ncbi:hypothetical protein LENED_004656 [Lentinula edodes]|uniref:Uncharacterized protein n=1 Tax=Lentinula edodes TaxID=5353 RepID=A0A1Q3E6V7_LENED|nr:hypothetical protein LENED_004656 [Lentinula edodes]